MDFIQQLNYRNETLFYFGCICFVLAIAFFVLTKTTSTQVYKVNAWYKPFKFAVSIAIYSWSMAWYCYYLNSFNIHLFNWTVVVLWSFEIIYIAFQAGRGKLSHYNLSTPFYSVMYSCMAMAASIVTVYTAYIGYLFFTHDFPALPNHYVWAVRLGILIFVVFSFEGFAMGSRLNHSVGAVNDNSNWFVLGWSKTVGDLRVSHFIGMHALQILPLLSFYLLKNTPLTIGLATVYALLAIVTLVQAIQGKPLIRSKNTSTGITNNMK